MPISNNYPYIMRKKEDSFPTIYEDLQYADGKSKKVVKPKVTWCNKTCTVSYSSFIGNFGSTHVSEAIIILNTTSKM